MSGIRTIPRLWKMSSASGVVGPLAPSPMIFALTRGAFSDVRTPSRAHGARMSTSSSKTSSFETGFVPGERPSDREGLARDDTGDREALGHRDRVHDPGHRLAVRVHVGRGDVLLRADDDRDLGRVPAGHMLELVLRHFLRVADYSALRAAVGNAHDRALPRHPAG